MNIEEIRDGVAYLDACLAEIAERGDDAEQEAFEAGLAERARLMQLAERHAEIAKLADMPERHDVPRGPEVIRKADPVDVLEDRSATATQIGDAVIRSVETAGSDTEQVEAVVRRHLRQFGGASEENREWARRLIVRAQPVYMTAFAKYLGGEQFALTNEERTALSVGSSTNGGVLVPTHLDPTLILTSDGSSNAIRQIARVETLTVGNTGHFVSTAGVTASWDGELAEVSDDSPTFNGVSIPTYVAQAFVQSSIAATQDIAGLQQSVLMLLADAKDRLEGAAHATGTGSGQPTGVVTKLDATTTSEVGATTSDAIGLVDLHKVYRNVPVRFRANSTWVMHPIWSTGIKALGTAVSASYSGDLRDPTAGRILGLPVVESDDMPSTQNTSKNNVLVVGDFSNYIIVDMPGSMAVEAIPHLFNTSNNLPDGRRGWFAYWRTGADVANTAALRLLQDQ